MKPFALYSFSALIGWTFSGGALAQSFSTELQMYNRLPSFHTADKKYEVGEKFFSDAYMEMAEHLQKIGKDKAIAFMKTPVDSENVIVLCRMLFTAKPMKEFRRPLIGAPHLFGRTTTDDWKLEPIEIIDGVPFVIVRGYSLGGRAETGRAYLDYAAENCDWSTVEYAKKTADENQKALAKLIESKKWKDTLDDEQKKFLIAQIK